MTIDKATLRSVVDRLESRAEEYRREGLNTQAEVIDEEIEELRAEIQRRDEE